MYFGWNSKFRKNTAADGQLKLMTFLVTEEKVGVNLLVT